MEIMQNKAFLGAIFVCGIVWGINGYIATHQAVSNWKTYHDAKSGFTISYPPTYWIEEDKDLSEIEALDLDIHNDSKADGNLSTGYESLIFNVHVTYSHSLPGVETILMSGPLPRTEKSNGTDVKTHIERKIGQISGVEIYGYNSLIHQYIDDFYYKNGDFFGQISLRPIAEGHLALERKGENVYEAVSEVDPNMYKEILSTIKMVKD